MVVINKEIKPEYQWYEFYKDRVNTDYQTYFEKRYKPMIDTLLFMKGDVIREEGIGIGSITKALIYSGSSKAIYGFDYSEKMLELCMENTYNGVMLYEDNILEPKQIIHYDIACTHGVLEHFDDIQIQTIIARYNYDKKSFIHYVPTDKYLCGTFGDERLLSLKYWLNLVKPTDYILFNDNYDLLLIKE